MMQRLQCRLQEAPRSRAVPRYEARPAAMACMRSAVSLVVQVALAIPVLARLVRGLAKHVAMGHVAPAVGSWVAA